MITTLPLHFPSGHLFVDLDSGRWLLDTGAPTSFGNSRDVTIADEQFNISGDHLGLDAATLSQFVGVPCVGLLGADVLSRFDHVFNTVAGTLTVSADELSHAGQRVDMDEFMGIPIISARIEDHDYRMFFDTGAQLSYFQDESLAEFPSTGSVTDFYPGFGEFQAETHEVPMLVGGIEFRLRCGALPGLLGATLMMAGTEGIVGNALLGDRVVGYFPRRRIVVL